MRLSKSHKITIDYKNNIAIYNYIIYIIYIWISGSTMPSFSARRDERGLFLAKAVSRFDAEPQTGDPGAVDATSLYRSPWIPWPRKMAGRWMPWRGKRLHFFGGLIFHLMVCWHRGMAKRFPRRRRLRSKTEQRGARAQAIRWRRCSPSLRKRARTQCFMKTLETVHRCPKPYSIFLAKTNLCQLTSGNIKMINFRNLVGRKQNISNLLILKQAGNAKPGQIDLKPLVYSNMSSMFQTVHNFWCSSLTVSINQAMSIQAGQCTRTKTRVTTPANSDAGSWKC